MRVRHVAALLGIALGTGLGVAIHLIISNNWLLACRAYEVRYSLPP